MLDYSAIPYVVEPMQEDDIEPVIVIEREAFSAPWTASAYRHELRHNGMAHYWVVRKQHAPVSAPPRATPRARRRFWNVVFGEGALQPPVVSASRPALPPILGHGGFWLMAGEAHISTIATVREWRGKHLGELLLAAMIEQAQAWGAEVATLEVRVSNAVAQNLYRKYRFSVAGRRKRYYSDNGEDALIMTTNPLHSAAFQEEFTRLKAQLWERLRVAAP
ncbi:MAG: ribosomal protein S18-alanine N-acetyltransferase [Chloroflexi bacterium]|nr:ribosomal protein S18-alanine N-acetyltransferase [Chloroflexota bacterium]